MANSSLDQDWESWFDLELALANELPEPPFDFDEEAGEEEVGKPDSCEDADSGDPSEQEDESEDFQYLNEDSLSREPVRADSFGRRSRQRQGKRQPYRGAQRPLKKNHRRVGAQKERDHREE